MLQRTACESVERAIAEAGLTAQDIVVTVVGTPGILDATTGTGAAVPEPARLGAPRAVARAGRRRSAAGGSEVMVENDANLSVVGEHARGAAQGVDVGRVSDGRHRHRNGACCSTENCFRGAHGAAGEIADLPFEHGFRRGGRNTGQDRSRPRPRRRRWCRRPTTSG